MKKAVHRSKTKKKTGKKTTYSFHVIHIVIGVIVLMVVGFLLFTYSSHQQSRASTKKLVALAHRPSMPVCGLPGRGKVHCHAHVITNSSGTPLASNTPYSGSYGPTQFHTAYNLPCTPGGSVQSTCSQPTSFGPQTVAIVDAYNDQTIQNDLNTYDTAYNLPSCTQANGCLQIVNEYGQATLPTSTDSGWALETSLDVEIAHATCQTCKILLVETNSNYMSDLATGVSTAANLGATAISNSYGGPEWSGETSYDSYYDHPGIAVTASAGDNSYGSSYPAAANGVVSVGGTTLQLYTDSTYANETVWSGTGSGCSLYEKALSWQTSLPNWGQTGCGSYRGLNDVAADADPNTGAAVYDSTPYNGTSGWYQVGGTSLSSPLIASVFALAGGVGTGVNATQIPYASFTQSNSHDVQSGTNGTCSTIMCLAGTGYDGPTGMGTPNGISGFMVNQAVSTPIPTAISTPTPTPTPFSKLKPTHKPNNGKGHAH